MGVVTFYKTTIMNLFIYLPNCFSLFDYTAVGVGGKDSFGHFGGLPVGMEILFAETAVGDVDIVVEAEAFSVCPFGVCGLALGLMEYCSDVGALVYGFAYNCLFGFGVFVEVVLGEKLFGLLGELVWDLLD